MLFSNKLSTLLYLKDRLTQSTILDSLWFTVEQYTKDKRSIIKKIATEFDEEVIIRSSASTEDQTATNAGHFLSFQHINSQSEVDIAKSVSNIVEAYTKEGLSTNELIFVQKQIKDVIFSGVAFSREPTHGKPYFVVNYDDTGSTDSVTGGKCNKMLYIARDYSDSNSIAGRLSKAFTEIEEICCCENLNIEFAVTQSLDVIVFQVRRIRQFFVMDKKIETMILANKNNYKNNCDEIWNDILSDMAFWNPSEMIGDNPHPLDFSLYDYLITESAWNEGIVDIGYSPVKRNLMIKIGNKPYISTKLSFIALTPASLPRDVRNHLVNYYMYILRSNKKLHDKIEFVIAHTCYGANTHEMLKLLLRHGFSLTETILIEQSLKIITEQVITNYEKIAENDWNLVEQLNISIDRYSSVVSSLKIEETLDAIRQLLPLIKYSGTVPFARHARCAFIARAICESLIETHNIDRSAFEGFIASVDTVTSQLIQDAIKYDKGMIGTNEMLHKYGHLRQRTYDITSPTYKDIGIGFIFNKQVTNKLRFKNNKSVHLPELHLRIDGSDYNISSFVSMSTIQREKLKFAFTKGLSLLLDLINQIASLMGISSIDFSFLSISEVLDCKHLSRNEILSIINTRKRNFNINSGIILPSIISDRRDFDVVSISQSLPNFITDKCVKGKVCILDGLSLRESGKIDISDKIIVIKSADPGFDWIFTRGPALGLITQYGGVASHMAIRCMEFGLPAAIGCGELIYSLITSNKDSVISLDCSKKKVIILK